MRLRLLVSFHYYRNTDLDALVAAFPSPPDVFADSGAFSAYSQGAEVQLDDYVAWLDRWSHHFTVISNLDVIQNPRATRDNQKQLEDLGHHPIPVFHVGEPWEYLDSYIEQGCGYIALGGMVGSNDQALKAWLVKAFLKAREQGTLFHGFGMTRLGVLSAFPWYSVDSSSWGAGHRFGQLDLWDPSRKRFVKVKLGSHTKVYEHADLIRAHGGDPAAFARPGFGLVEEKPIPVHRAERAAIISCNARAWLFYEEFLRARHGTIGPPEDTGPKIYLADSRGHGGLATNEPDLVLGTQHWTETGPKVYLADGSDQILKMTVGALRTGDR